MYWKFQRHSFSSAATFSYEYLFSPHAIGTVEGTVPTACPRETMIRFVSDVTNEVGPIPVNYCTIDSANFKKRSYRKNVQYSWKGW